MQIIPFRNLGIGDPTTRVYQFICDEKDRNKHTYNKIFYYVWIGIMYQGR